MISPDLWNKIIIKKDYTLFFKQSNYITYKTKHEDLLFSMQKNTDNITSKMIKTKNGRLQSKSQCSICGNKNRIFVKEQEAKVLLSSLGIRNPLSNIPGLNILF